MFHADHARAGRRNLPLVTFIDGRTLHARELPSLDAPVSFNHIAGRARELNLSLRGATFRNVEFTGPRSGDVTADAITGPLTDARFVNCSGLRFHRAELGGADLLDCTVLDAVNTDLAAARIESSTCGYFDQVDLHDAILRDITIAPATHWHGVDLSDAVIDGLRTTRDVYLAEVQLSGAVIKRSYLNDTTFLTTEPWHSTRWQDVRLNRVDFGTTLFDRNDFRAVTLNGAVITAARFDHSTFDTDVDLPTDGALYAVLGSPGVYVRSDSLPLTALPDRPAVDHATIDRGTVRPARGAAVAARSFPPRPVSMFNAAAAPAAAARSTDGPATATPGVER